MLVLDSIDALKTQRAEWANETVVLVPTMGALHDGHLSLFHLAKTLGTKAVVSIFVNPLQFGPSEDWDRYPRSMEADLAMCKAHGMDLVFTPTPDMLYPKGCDQITQVVPPVLLEKQLCGLSRPGHFTGVATVVLKLLDLVQPQMAVFGQKDAQQLAIVRRMVADLDVPVTIVPAPTVRQPNGMALSSRNQYLTTPEERLQAQCPSRLLLAVQTLYRQGVTAVETACQQAIHTVIGSGDYPDFRLEYLSAVDEDTFLPVTELSDNSRILVAGHIGSVRLIDNLHVTETLTTTLKSIGEGEENEIGFRRSASFSL